jgi:hypothetical protein
MSQGEFTRHRENNTRDSNFFFETRAEGAHDQPHERDDELTRL